jgi:putative adenylate-forming enzyme
MTSLTTATHFARHFLAAHWRWRTLDAAALARFQEQRARAAVAYAHAHSPFHRDHWAGHNLADWRTLPTVDKATMMANFDRFNTVGVTRAAALDAAMLAEQSRDFRPTVGAYTVGLSSGTSGHRGAFLVSPAEQGAWAGLILARALHRLRRGGVRVAFFLRSFSNLYAQANGRLVKLRYFDLMTPILTAVAQLNAFQPHIVIGPPSLLGLLANAQESGALHLAPDRLISVAEVLEPQDQARLAAVFQAPVHQIYQCTEGLLAVSCARGSLHIQEDVVALQLEPLDASSAWCTPIVTDLWRRTQPIIRYRLNDVVRLAPAPCPCGSPFRVLATIAGRCDDLCYFFDSQGTRQPVFPDTLRRAILLSSDAVIDYEIEQTHDGQLQIHLLTDAAVPFEVIARAVIETTQATLVSYALQPAVVTVTAGLTPRPADAKRRRVQRRAIDST